MSRNDRDENEGSVATKPKTRNPKSKPLPPWKVLLHKDDTNSIDYAKRTIVELTPLNEQAADLRALEADKTGIALILVTHKERAELYQDQFKSKGMIVTIEPESN